MDKETQVQMLLREKEDKIMSLEQQLQQEKYDEQAEIQLANLQREFEQMQIEHRTSLAEKEEKIQTIIDLHKDDPKIY